MSRLGDLILLERTRQRMTPKQVAKKCGITEKYLLEVESGKRIIADDQARRILKSIGLREHNEIDFSLDEIAATVDLETLRIGQGQQASPGGQGTAPAPAREMPAAARRVASTESAGAEGAGHAGGIWLDALAGVLKSVPVYNAAWSIVDRRLLPISNGRIEGGAPEKVFYFLAPDDSMRGFRVLSGDWALIVPSQSPIDEAIMLVEYRQHRALRKVRKLDAQTVLLQSFDREYLAEPLSVNEVTFTGRAVRLEISL
jgi:transcriptional regulator with XRE-family HTH domain